MRSWAGGRQGEAESFRSEGVRTLGSRPDDGWIRSNLARGAFGRGVWGGGKVIGWVTGEGVRRRTRATGSYLLVPDGQGETRSGGGCKEISR